MSSWIPETSTLLWTGAALSIPIAYHYLSSSKVGVLPRDLYGVPVTPKPDGESPIYRSFRAVDAKKLQTTFEGADTIYQAFQASASRFPNKECMGTRKLVEVIKEETVVRGEKKTWEYYKMGPYEWLTYSEVLAKAHQFGSGLKNLGLDSGSNFGIYLDTRAEWRLASLGCHSQSITVVTIYANLGREGLLHGFNECEVTHILTSASNIPNLVSMASNNELPKLKTIIYTDELRDDVRLSAEKALNVNFLSFEDVLQLGKDKPVSPNPPAADDVALIMYTSGTTGLPKGVMITHRNVMSSVASLAADGKADDKDVALSYLPLAHILAFTLETACYTLGMTIGYGSPRTIADSSVRQCSGDIKELRPTFFIGVPTILDRIKQGMLNLVSKSSPLQRKIFEMAFQSKKKAVAQNQSSYIWDLVVFNKMREALGGRIRFFVCGGAPISLQAQEFFQTCFGVPFLQGYGLTETCGVVSGKELSQRDLGNTGGPFPVCEIKLVDVPEMKYFSHDQPCPRGEIWVRGANVSKGYYKNPSKTAEDFTEDGWFKTGDIGQWNPNGTLSIIDRKKNLVKPPHGEYIAVERLESIYKNSLFVSNIMVYADSDHNELIALIHPNKNKVEEFAEKKGIHTDDWPALCKDASVKKAILDDLRRVAQSNHLRSIEKISNVVLYPDEWTPENNWLTSAMKLRRFDIKIKQKDAIESAYAELNGE